MYFLAFYREEDVFSCEGNDFGRGFDEGNLLFKFMIDIGHVYVYASYRDDTWDMPYHP